MITAHLTNREYRILMDFLKGGMVQLEDLMMDDYSDEQVPRKQLRILNRVWKRLEAAK